VCVFVTAVSITKLFAWGDSEGDSGGQLLRETTSRGLCGLWNQVFHGCVGIRKALKAVSQVLDGGRGGGHRRSSLCY
jgi:hypothetical protein